MDAPTDGTWFIGKMAGQAIPAVMRAFEPVTDYTNLDAPPTDWRIEARALNASTMTWRYSSLEAWWGLPPSATPSA